MSPEGEKQEQKIKNQKIKNKTGRKIIKMKMTLNRNGDRDRNRNKKLFKDTVLF